MKLRATHKVMKYFSPVGVAVVVVVVVVVVVLLGAVLVPGTH
jgi:Mg2+/Co2+ transporter CorB